MILFKNNLMIMFREPTKKDTVKIKIGKEKK